MLKFILRYFIVFAIKNGIVFFISFLVKLSVCGNATDFCILILSSATLLNLLVLTYFVESLRCSIYKIMSSASRDNFTSSLLF